MRPDHRSRSESASRFSVGSGATGGCSACAPKFRVVDSSPLVHIDGTNLTIPLVKNISAGRASVKLDDSVRPLIQAGRELVETTVKAGKPVAIIHGAIR